MISLISGRMDDVFGMVCIFVVDYSPFPVRPYLSV